MGRAALAELDYRARVAMTRALPQHTAKDRAEKRWSAEMLRQSNLWSNAFMADSFFTHLKDLPPDPTDTQLIDTIGPEIRTVKPEIRQSWLDGWKKFTEGIRRKTDSLAAPVLGETHQSHEPTYEQGIQLGSAFFKKLTGENPLGSVLFFSHPMAVGMAVSNIDDYNALPGLFKEEGGFVTTIEEPDGSSYSLMVARAANFGIHLLNHLEENVIMQVIADLGISSWPEPTKRFNDVRLRLIQEISQLPNYRSWLSDRDGAKPPSQERLLDIFKRVLLPSALNRAKGELLAHFMQDTNKSAVYQNRRSPFDIGRLYEQDGLYDYFAQIVNPLQSEESGKPLKDKVLPAAVHGDIWKEYTDQVRKFEILIVKYLNLMPSSLGNQGFFLAKFKNQLFPYVLAQIPVSQWETQITRLIEGRQVLVSSLNDDRTHIAGMARDWNLDLGRVCCLPESQIVYEPEK